MPLRRFSHRLFHPTPFLSKVRTGRVGSCTKICVNCPYVSFDVKTYDVVHWEKPHFQLHTETSFGSMVYIRDRGSGYMHQIMKLFGFSTPCTWL